MDLENSLLVCDQCKHEQRLDSDFVMKLAERTGKRLFDIDMNFIAKNINRFVCSKCGAKSVHFVEETPGQH